MEKEPGTSARCTAREFRFARKTAHRVLKVEGYLQAK